MEKKIKVEAFLEEARKKVIAKREEAILSLAKSKEELSSATKKKEETSASLDKLIEARADKDEIHPAKVALKEANNSYKKALHLEKGLSRLVNAYGEERFVVSQEKRFAKELAIADYLAKEEKEKEPMVLSSEEMVNNAKGNAEKAHQEAGAKRDLYLADKNNEEKKKGMVLSQNKAEAADKELKKAKNALYKAEEKKSHPWYSLTTSFEEQFHLDERGEIPFSRSIKKAGRYCYRGGTAYIILLVLFLVFGIINPTF